MDEIIIYEVGPRDGLQNLDHIVPTEDKIKFINLLRRSGLSHIEVASFAHPKRVPQMADAEEVFDGQGSVLVMNQRGMDRAVKSGATYFNIVYSPSEQFNYRNLGCGLKDAVGRYIKMLEGVPKANVRVYISCYFGCPYEGKISDANLEKAIKFATLFGDTVVLSDTIGVAVPDDIVKAVDLVERYGLKPALHLHVKLDNLRGGLELVNTGYNAGIREFDSSMGGLGGCFLIEDSPGNLPTEALIAWAHEKDVDCGVDFLNIKEALHMALSLKQPLVL